jgi:hypothetical protein
MSKNIKRRIERLEEILEPQGVRIIINCETQAAPGVGSPPPRPQGPEGGGTPAPPRPLQITK